MISIESYIHRRAVILNQDSPAHIVAKAMRENSIGCVLLTDNLGRLAGIATDRDFACRWAADYPTSDIPISRIMTPNVVKASESSSLSSIVSLMENHGIRRIPIVGTSPRGLERVIGIITLDDLIASGSITPNQLAQVVRRQIGNRLSSLPRVPRSARSVLRSDAHVHQTLDKFYASLVQATGLSAELTPQVVQFLLSVLVMRVTATTATHFIAQIPKLLQDSLLRLPSGPDRSLTYQYILAELASRFRLPEELARRVFSQFLAGLAHLMDPGQIRHLKSQLPLELQAAFPSEVQAASAG